MNTTRCITTSCSGSYALCRHCLNDVAKHAAAAHCFLAERWYERVARELRYVLKETPRVDWCMRALCRCRQRALDLQWLRPERRAREHGPDAALERI